MIRGAIFDMDGTLLDSMGIWMTLGRDYLADLGITAEPNLGEILYPMTMKQGVSYLKNRYGLDGTKEQIEADLARRIEDFYERQAPAKPGAYRFLKQLKETGVRLAVATVTKESLARAALERTGILPLLDDLRTVDQAGAGKDRPDIYLQTAAALGTEPGETLVFEDALHAAQTASAAGFPVIGVYDPSGEEKRVDLERFALAYLTDFTRFDRFAREVLSQKTAGKDEG